MKDTRPLILALFTVAVGCSDGAVNPQRSKLTNLPQRKSSDMSCIKDELGSNVDQTIDNNKCFNEIEQSASEKSAGQASNATVEAPVPSLRSSGSQSAPVAESNIAESKTVSATVGAIQQSQGPSISDSAEKASIDLQLQQQNEEFRQRILFVDSAYKSCLGRAPDGPGLVYWSNLIATQTLTFDKVKSSICSSGEAQIVNIYKEILGRIPDPRGLEYWKSLLSKGTLNIDQIRQSIIGSAEGIARTN